MNKRGNDQVGMVAECRECGKIYDNWRDELLCVCGSTPAYSKLPTGYLMVSGYGVIGFDEISDLWDMLQVDKDSKLGGAVSEVLWGDQEKWKANERGVSVSGGRDVGSIFTRHKEGKMKKTCDGCRGTGLAFPLCSSSCDNCKGTGKVDIIEQSKGKLSGGDGVIAEALCDLENCSDWDASFANSIYKQVKSGKGLTSNQKNKAEEILSRYGK